MSKEEAQTKYVELCKSLGADVDGTGASASATAAPKASEGGYTAVTVKVSDKGVMTVTMSRPDKLNAISFEMYRELERAFDEAAADKAVKALVLTGAGSWYSAGNDLSNFTRNMPPEGPTKLAADAAELLEGFVNKFIDFPKPLIAAVNGPAVGIPVTTLGLCDFVFASHTATFETPFTRLGQSPEACSSVTFPAIMGRARANEILLAGRKLHAAEAKEWGLVNDVFEQSSFTAEVGAFAERIASLPPNSMKHSKAIIMGHSKDSLKATNRAECELLEKLWVADECLGAITAFMSRRK
jgi:Delta3-Delta2-enoyl-CoA isomerase